MSPQTHWSTDEISLRATARSPVDARADLLVLPVFEGPAAGPGVPETGARLRANLVALLEESGVKGEAGETLRVQSFGRLPARAILLVGLGPRAKAGPVAVREATQGTAGEIVEAATVATTLPQVGRSREDSARSFAEGLLLGAYRFDRYKRSPVDERSRRVPSLGAVEAVTDTRGLAQVRAGLRRGEVHARATNWVRDMVNLPPSEATPEHMAAAARDMARRSGLSCRVWSEAALERGGFGGILGVGRGSANDPRLVELTYRRGRANDRPIALTGKGITFDSGGLDLKRGSELEWMKADMAGGAAALAVMRAIAELKLRVNVIAAIPFADNLPGEDSIRPGDVLRHRGGKTTEVLDTDAEGRLVLADALAYLAEKAPAVIIDSATLTDAGGLGAELWSIMGTDRRLISELLSAGEEAGEPGWQLPLWEGYRTQLESDVADIKNMGDHGYDSSSFAGLFLSEFAGDVPWAHLDIGMTAWRERETDTWPQGPTGSPTRTILRYIERRAERSPR